MTEIVSNFPGEFRLCDRRAAQTDLHTVVRNKAQVLRTSRVTGGQRDGREQNVVLRLPGIIVHIQAQPTLQHTQLKTTFDRSGRDRTDVRVGKGRWVTQGGQSIGIDRTDHIGLIDTARIDGGAAHLCPGGTHLGEVNEFRHLDQLRHDHRTTNRRIEDGVKARVQHRKPVISARNRQIESVVIIKVRLTEYRIRTIRCHTGQGKPADIGQIAVHQVRHTVKVGDHPLCTIGRVAAIIIFLLVCTYHHVQTQLVAKEPLIVIDK